MRIDRLDLSSFGKFRDREIGLAPGLNVGFGPNEAGKSTIERFVFGMLYGASRFGLKTRRMRDDFESLHPWGGDAFEGRMVFTLDSGRRMRVERDFASGDVNVRDDVTGEKIEYEVDRRRESTFARELLGLSGPEFEGTVCIGQMRTSEIGEESTTAIVGHMARVLTGGGGHSAADALAILGQRDSEIGSERAPTKPLAQAMRRSKKIRESLEKTARDRRSNLEREAKLRELRKHLVALEAREAELGCEIEAAERAERRSIVERVGDYVEQAAKYEEDARHVEEELKPLAPLGEIPSEDAHGVKAKLEAYSDRKKAEERAGAEGWRRRQEVADLEREVRASGIHGDPVEVQARLDELQNEITQAQMEIARRASTAPPSGTKVLTVVWALLALVAAAAGIGFGVAVSPLGLLMAVLAVPFAILAMLAARSARTAGERWSSQEAEIQRLAGELEAKEAALQKLQREHDCSGPGELKSKLATAARKEGELARARDVLHALEGVEGEPAETILQSLLGTLAFAAPCSRRIARAVESGKVGEAEAEEFTGLYRAFVDASNRLEKARGDAGDAWRLASENARGLKPSGADWAGALEKACVSRNLAGARAAADAGREGFGTEGESPGAGTGRSIPDLRGERQKVASEVLGITGEARELAGKIEEAHADLPDPGGLAREKLELEEKIDAFRLRHRAIERASDVIRRVAEQMHRDFAPGLASRVGPIVKHLTGGRYASVRIGEALGLTAEMPEASDLIPVEKLSAGTLDQFYFALRVGAALEVAGGGEKPPVICDESLARYDDERALACLKYLHELGAEYQILLLTCHEREREAAREMGANTIVL